MNWRAIATYSIYLSMIQFGVGLSEGFFFSSGLRQFAVGTFTSLSMGSVVFALLAYRHCDRPFAQATIVLLCYFMAGLALAGFSSIWFDFSGPPVLVAISSLALVIAMVVGTLAGCIIRRKLNRSSRSVATS